MALLTVKNGTTMGGVLSVSGPDTVGRRLMLRLLTVSREVRTMVVATAHVHPDARGLGTTAEAHDAHHQHEAAVLDAVAGSEFVDDRIRLLE